jgi:hypothetical protein
MIDYYKLDMHVLFANELLVKTMDIPEDLRVSTGGN